MRVVDLGTFWAGPYCTMYLGALGADVIKVESIRRPDGFRFSGAVPEMGPDWYERGGVFAGTNLNKRDVTLDLTTDEGRELLSRLVADADVVLENFSARVVEAFGLDYDAVRAIKPDVVMVRMPGFGLVGPWRDYVGWAMVIEQATGMASVTGPPERPMHPGGPADPIIGMHAAVAVQAALEHRDRTGQGQLIEVAQLETGANLAAELVVEWSAHQRTLPRRGNRDPHAAPQGVYPTAPEPTGPTWVAITVADDAQWRALTNTIGRPDWAADPTLADAAGRRARHDELDAGLSAWVGARRVDDAVAALDPRRRPRGAGADRAHHVRRPAAPGPWLLRHARPSPHRAAALPRLADALLVEPSPAPTRRPHARAAQRGDPRRSARARRRRPGRARRPPGSSATSSPPDG